MSFGQERLDVHRAAPEYLGSVDHICRVALDRIVAMPTRLGRRACIDREDPAEYSGGGRFRCR